MAQIPVTDPDDAAELLCNGPFYLSFHGHGQTTLAILTFTQLRPDPAALFQDNTVKENAIVRARIVMNIPNFLALRDLLSK